MLPQWTRRMHSNCNSSAFGPAPLTIVVTENKRMHDAAKTKRKPSMLMRLAPGLLLVLAIGALGSSLLDYRQNNGSLLWVIVEPGALLVLAWGAHRECYRYDHDKTDAP